MDANLKTKQDFNSENQKDKKTNQTISRPEALGLSLLPFCYPPNEEVLKHKEIAILLWI